MKILGLAALAVISGSAWSQSTRPSPVLDYADYAIPCTFNGSCLPELSSNGRGLGDSIAPFGDRFFRANEVTGAGCVEPTKHTGQGPGPAVDILTVNIGLLEPGSYVTVLASGAANIRRTPTSPTFRGGISGVVDLQVETSPGTFTTVGALPGTQRSFWRNNMDVDNLTYTANLQITTVGLFNPVDGIARNARVRMRASMDNFGTPPNVTQYAVAPAGNNAICGASMLVTKDPSGTTRIR